MVSHQQPRFGRHIPIHPLGCLSAGSAFNHPHLAAAGLVDSAGRPLPAGLFKDVWLRRHPADLNALLRTSPDVPSYHSSRCSHKQNCDFKVFLAQRLRVLCVAVVLVSFSVSSHPHFQQRRTCSGDSQRLA